MAVMKNSWGSVKVYIRHASGCEQINLPDTEAKCHCAKWLYENKRGEKPVRRTLNTYSWAEAQGIATRTLEGFNPDVTKARQLIEKKNTGKVTVDDAFKLWYDRKVIDLGEDSGSLPKYRYLGRKLKDWARRKHFDDIQEITTLALERWYLSDEWRKLAPYSQAVSWGVMRSFFAFLVRRGLLDQDPIFPIDAVNPGKNHVQGPYTDQQVDAIFSAIDKLPLPLNRPEEVQRNYHRRLHAFILLLLHSGCDVVDATLFKVDQIKKEKLNRREVYVFSYSRRKTGEEAVIPLPSDISEIILNVPRNGNNPQGMPFRSPSSPLYTDSKQWSRRVARCLRLAGVDHVILKGTDDHGRIKTKAANTKQFRHTFAVRQLEAGQRPEDVARMMGHVDVSMIRRHYAPWVDSLKKAHLERVMSIRKK